MTDRDRKIEITPEQYGSVGSALQRIAFGRHLPRRQNLTRDEMIFAAREACDALGLGYDRAAVEGL